MPQEDVSVPLTGDEALVLFDLLHRWEDAGRVTQPENHAERIALWNLTAVLERTLVEPLDPRYQELLAAARARLVSA